MTSAYNAQHCEKLVADLREEARRSAWAAHRAEAADQLEAAMGLIAEFEANLDQPFLALVRERAVLEAERETLRARVADLEAQNRALQSGALQSFATQRTGLVRELELERDALRARMDDACWRSRELERQRDEHRASLNQIADRLHVVHEDPKIMAAVTTLCSERDHLREQIRLLTADQADQTADQAAEKAAALAAIDEDACAELFVAFQISSVTASQRALWGADHPALPPGTCRYCGKPRQKWTGSKLDGHAACIVTEDFKRRVGDVLRTSPRLTYAAIAKLLNVTPGIVRSWAFAAGIAGPIQTTTDPQETR